MTSSTNSNTTSRIAHGVEIFFFHSHFIPICFLAFLLLRLALMLFVPVTPTSDFLWYHARAVDLIEGRGFSEGGVPTAYWPIGWPAAAALIYSIFGQKIAILQAANLVFASASFFLILAIGREIFKSQLASRIGIFLITIYPNNIAYTSLTATETFYTFLLLLGTWIFISQNTFISKIICGLVFGYATLTKPQTLFMPFILMGIGFIFQQGTRPKLKQIANGAVVALAMAIIIAPWMYRNYLVFGEPVFISTNSGWALYVGNNPSAMAYKGFPTDDGPEVKALWNETFSVANQLQSSHAARDAALKWIRENPITYLCLMPIKAFSLWSVDGEAEWSYQIGSPLYDKYRVIFRAVRIINQVIYSIIFIGFFVGGILLIRRYFKYKNIGNISIWVVSVYGYSAYTTLQCMIMAGSYRYKFPLIPLLALSCAWVISIWIKKNASKTEQKNPPVIYP